MRLHMQSILAITLALTAAALPLSKRDAAIELREERLRRPGIDYRDHTPSHTKQDVTYHLAMRDNSQPHNNGGESEADSSSEHLNYFKREPGMPIEIGWYTPDSAGGNNGEHKPAPSSPSGCPSSYDDGGRSKRYGYPVQDQDHDKRDEFGYPLQGANFTPLPGYEKRDEWCDFSGQYPGIDWEAVSRGTWTSAFSSLLSVIDDILRYMLKYVGSDQNPRVGQKPFSRRIFEDWLAQLTLCYLSNTCALNQLALKFFTVCQVNCSICRSVKKSQSRMDAGLTIVVHCVPFCFLSALNNGGKSKISRVDSVDASTSR